jgi:hypothetical protein
MVDLQSRAVTLTADLRLERGALNVSEEPAAICASPEGRVRVFWRQGPGLWVCEISEYKTLQKRNLRGVWDDAIGED